MSSEQDKEQEAVDKNKQPDSKDNSIRAPRHQQGTSPAGGDPWAQGPHPGQGPESAWQFSLLPAPSMGFGPPDSSSQTRVVITPLPDRGPGLLSAQLQAPWLYRTCACLAVLLDTLSRGGDSVSVLILGLLPSIWLCSLFRTGNSSSVTPPSTRTWVTCVTRGFLHGQDLACGLKTLLVHPRPGVWARQLFGK